MADGYLPRLDISYSAKQEVRRVRDTLERLSWYQEEGYRVDLPGGITKESDDEEVMRAVEHEYAAASYAEHAATLQKEWEALHRGFGRMKEEPTFHLEDEYNVVLTKYGVGGSYDPNLNKVTVKVSARPRGGIAGIVVHEVVHLAVQYLIDLHQLPHWRKERLVDLVVERYFPGLRKMQDIAEDVSIVDRAFEKYFPNMEEVVRSIGG